MFPIFIPPFTKPTIYAIITPMTQKPKIDPTESRKGKIYLWLAILIFGAAAAVVAKLIMLGENALLDGRNPIAFCNLLFAGNVVAGLTLLAIFHRDWRPLRTQKTDPQTVADTVGIGSDIRRVSTVPDVPSH